MKALSAPLPLRTSADWTVYRTAQAIPHRYGDTGGELLQYDAQRLAFVWADHAVQAIDQVRVDGQIVGGWEWANAADSSGRTVAFVRFTESVDEGASVTARGRGKLDPHAGGLMTNPAAIILDILTSIAGNPVTRAELELFRRECDAAELTLAGTLDDETITIQSAIRAICTSVGAAFAPDAAGLAFLWPGGSVGPALRTIERGPLTASMSLSELVTDLTLRFDFDNGTPRQTVQLDAPAAVVRYGRRAQVLDAHWLRTVRNAISVGTRLLQQSARPVWSVEAPALPRVLRVGDAVAMSHSGLPIATTVRVLGRTVSLADATTDVQLQVPAGAAPSVRVVRQSSLIEPSQYASASVQTVAGERIITVNDTDGTPLAGASVTLNGEVTRTTDASGRVGFPVSLMPPGQYELTVVAPDGRTFVMLVQV